jgi:hypothetical protein
LPRNKTPFEVWFGRKPQWITAEPLEPLEDDADECDTNDESDDDKEDDEDPVLTKIEA